MKYLLLTIFFITSIFAQSVEVEGIAYITTTKESAKKMAILDAKIKAVEKSIGTYIKSQTQMKDFEIKYDIVEQKVEGYVSSYTILSEDIKKDMIKLRIKADVKKGKINLDIDQLTSSLHEKKNPKFIIVSTGDSMISSIFESELKSFFLKNKIDVLDLETVNPYYKELISSNNEEMKSHSIKRIGADYIVNMHISRQNLQTNYKGESHKSVTLHIEANALNISNKQVITSKIYPNKISENKIIVESSLIPETKFIAKNFAKEFLIDIVDKWKENTYNGDKIEIEISNVKSYNQALEISEYLQSIIPNISQLFLKEFNKNLAFYDIKIQGGIDKFLDDLVFNNDRYQFDIKNKTSNKCEMTIK